MASRLIRFQDFDSSFHHGESLHESIHIIREAITHIRENWANYQDLIDRLTVFLQDADNLAQDDERRLIEDMYLTPKAWVDRNPDGHDTNDFSILRLYLSDFGYREVFGIAEEAMQTNSLVTVHDLIPAIFLIELLNIDLFNYTALHDEGNDFQGIVYRGSYSPETRIQEFRDLYAKPLPERYWAVPLPIMSASLSPNTALAHALAEPRRQSSHLLLWRIHVASLSPRSLEMYKSRFPTSVVSTICAVPVHPISPYPDEREVILRGPFFQLVRIADEIVDGVGSVCVIDLVMLNSNRDHPTTMELSAARGQKARELFAALVAMERFSVCKRLADSFNLSRDVQEYAQAYAATQEKVTRLANN
ncbi:hypothetical protein BD779DRAFT_213434 [Infundibulicybe gibba]|nr:hypothetical protein BD779DRAFT_213434 [Infundibulicybe gibba]